MHKRQSWFYEPKCIYYGSKHDYRNKCMIQKHVYIIQLQKFIRDLTNYNVRNIKTLVVCLHRKFLTRQVVLRVQKRSFVMCTAGQLAHIFWFSPRLVHQCAVLSTESTIIYLVLWVLRNSLPSLHQSVSWFTSSLCADSCFWWGPQM